MQTRLAQKVAWLHARFAGRFEIADNQVGRRSGEAGSVIDDIARAAIVALQLKTFDLPPEMLLQLDNVARRTSAEAVDGLIVISSNNQSRFLGDEAYESKIKLVDILKFIDDDLVVSPLNK